LTRPLGAVKLTLINKRKDALAAMKKDLVDRHTNRPSGGRRDELKEISDLRAQEY